MTIPLRALYLILCYICTIPSIQSCEANQMYLVINGRPNAEIIRPSNPTAVEQKAALVLQDYIRRITNTSLPIVDKPSGDKRHLILIGSEAVRQITPDHTERDLPAESYAIAADSKNLYILGGAGKGLLYGVYELIEKQFGARKYDQGPAQVTTSTSLGIPSHLSMTFAPPIIYRESFYPPSTDSEYLDWHHLHRFEDLWGIWGHSFFKIIPPEEYFESNPEFFALVNGKRQASQLCLSNEQVKAKTIAYFKAAIADNPDAIYWSISQMDGAGYCTCDHCRKADFEEGGPQGSIIRFVNAIATNFPRQKFTTLAYGYSAEAPLLTIPRDNVYIMLSSIDATRHQPLSTDPNAASFRKQLSAWHSKTDHLFVWDYSTQFTAYLTPFPMYDHYKSNIDYLQEHGVKGLFIQGSGYTLGDMSTFASYMQAKSMWDTSLSDESISDDFLTGYYGAAAKEIKKYIQQLLAARDQTKASLDIYANPISYRTSYLHPDKIKQYKKTLDNAKQVAHDNQQIIERINLLELGLEYAVLEQSKAFGKQQNGYLVQTQSGHWEVNPGYKNRIRNFIEQAESNGVTELSETNGSLQEYENNWLTRLNTPILNSIIEGILPKFSSPYIQDYPANGPGTLTDGIIGDLDYSYNWLLFQGNSLTIDIDMEKDIPLDMLRMSFLHDPKHYIFSPDQILVQGSRDGINYKSIGEYKLKPQVDYTKLHLPALISFPGTDAARYLRVIVNFPSILPDWFEGSRHRKPLIAIDELIVH